MIELLNGDCLELMKNIPAGSVDMVCTDPPYMINTKSTGAGKLNPWGTTATLHIGMQNGCGKPADS